MEFLTAEERATLGQRLKKLTDKRPVIIEQIAKARALGDLSENAEYHAACEEQGLNEAAIKYIEERLKKAKTVDTTDIPDDMVFIGATVNLRDEENGDEDMYKLVGESSGSFDMDVIEVTVQSPMGVSLMKARVGETVKVDLPRGIKRFTILEIV